MTPLGRVHFNRHLKSPGRRRWRTLLHAVAVGRLEVPLWDVVADERGELWLAVSGRDARGRAQLVRLELEDAEELADWLCGQILQARALTAAVARAIEERQAATTLH
jgi:hypothetical protein